MRIAQALSCVVVCCAPFLTYGSGNPNAEIDQAARRNLPTSDDAVQTFYAFRLAVFRQDWVTAKSLCAKDSSLSLKTADQLRRLLPKEIRDPSIQVVVTRIESRLEHGYGHLHRHRPKCRAFSHVQQES